MNDYISLSCANYNNFKVESTKWTASTLMSKVEENIITKPLNQRKRKWTKRSDVMGNHANAADYIKFLYKTKNTINAFSFGEKISEDKKIYISVDGNNRTWAIMEFIKHPLSIFNENNKILSDIINSSKDISIEDKNILINHIHSLNYESIYGFRRLKELYNGDSILEAKFSMIDQKGRDDIESWFENMTNILSIDGIGKISFMSGVSIMVNIFQDCTSGELCDVFMDINRYNSPLSIPELLAAELYHTPVKQILMSHELYTALLSEIVPYYNDKAVNEVVSSDIYNINNGLNAFEFMVSFQNYIANKLSYKNTIPILNPQKVSLFFDIYKRIYGSYTSEAFTDANIISFITYISKATKILRQFYEFIFPDNSFSTIKTTLVKKTTLPHSELYFMITYIIYRLQAIEQSTTANERCTTANEQGTTANERCTTANEQCTTANEQGTTANEQGTTANERDKKYNTLVLDVRRILLYHFFVKNINHKTEEKGSYEAYDDLHFGGCGLNIENKLNNYKLNLSSFGKDATSERMTGVIHVLINDTINNNTINNNTIKNNTIKNNTINNDTINNNNTINNTINPIIKPKRRKIASWETLLMIMLYKTQMSVKFLNLEYDKDHIIPFSCYKLGEYTDTLDRLGNLIPIDLSLNRGRGNGDISYYDSHPEFRNLLPCIPSNKEYNDIVDYTIPTKPVIKSIENYKKMCIKNENIYINNFIGEVFPEL